MHQPKSHRTTTRLSSALAIASTHVSFPGIGRVRTDGAGYAWMPVNYSYVK